MTTNCLIRLLTLLVIVYITAAVGGEQRFIETPLLYQQVKADEDVYLRCIVENKRGSCLWRKDQRSLVAQQGKYEWKSELTNNCTLLIRQVTLFLDDGFWECHHVSINNSLQQDLSSEPSRLVVMGEISI